MSTRDRLMEAAMNLFSRKGFRATTVGQIEEAAGLSPRAGAFYRHFQGKEEVFESCVDRWVADVRAFAATLALGPLPDLRSELTLIARGALQILGQQRQLLRFLALDAGQFPHLVAKVHGDLVTAGYEELMARFNRLAVAAGRETADVRAMAAIALGALVHYVDDEVVYGEPPAGADEESVVRVWVDLWTGYFEPRTRRRRRSPG